MILSPLLWHPSGSTRRWRIVDGKFELMIPLTRVTRRLRTTRSAERIRRLAGRGGASQHVRWEGTTDPGEAARALAAWAGEAVAATPGGWVLSVGDGDEFHQLVNDRLRRSAIRVETVEVDAIPAWHHAQTPSLAAVVCGYRDSRRIMRAAGALAHHPRLADVRFEYASGLDPERAAFERLDEYAATWFVSPVLVDDPSPYAIYNESLLHFEQKCGLRDYLDLYQVLRTAVRNDVPGDVAEFGSFRGHSGYLIARTLDALGSDKRVFLFDTFDTFPVEDLGVDRFWSSTHPVSFADVQAKFASIARAVLVRGDFTETLPRTDLGPLAVAYIDCDSYRATKYLIDALVPEKISPRGLLVCEDYGHPALLGNRLAVHESLADQPGFFQYFSQFSGLYITVRY